MVPGIVISYTCYGFRWIPTVWPDPLPPDVDPATIPAQFLPVYPPERPPLPEPVPPWSGGSPVLEITATPSDLKSAPQWAADGAWVLRMPLNFTDALNFHYQMFLDWLLSNESNGTGMNLSNFNYTAPSSVDLMKTLGLPEWAVPEAAVAQLETQETETQNATTEYLVLRSHCFAADEQDPSGAYLAGDFNWSQVPMDADFKIHYTVERFRFFNGTYVENTSNFNLSNLSMFANISGGMENASNASNASNMTSLFEWREFLSICVNSLFYASRFDLNQTLQKNFATVTAR